MSRYGSMHEHDNQRDAWLSLVEARAAGRKTLRYVAIIEGLNHSSSRREPRDYKEIALFQQWKRQAGTAREKTIPTSGEISLFIIAFL